MDLTASLHELFGFRELPARAARGLRGRARGPRRARGHAHRLGQVALLPAAGAAARRPHGGGLAARGADAGPGRGAAGARARRAAWRSSTRSRTRAPTPRRSSGPLAGELRLLYVAPERFAAPRLRRADAARPGSGCSWSTRRTASRSGGTTSGPTTSGWRDAARYARRAARSWPPRPRPRRGWPPTSAQRLGLRDPLRVATGFDRPNLSFAVARPAPHEKRALLAEACAARTRCRRSSTRARARAPRSSRGRARPRRSASRRWPTTRGSSASAAPRSSGASSPTRCAVIVRHQRVRHGRGQAERAHGGARQRAVVARGLLPGGRPRGPRRRARRGRCCSPRTATRRCTCTSSSATRSTRTCPAGWPTGSAAAADGDGRYALEAAGLARDLARRRRPAAGAPRPPRARGRDRALAGGARPRRRPDRSAASTAAPRRSAGPRSRRARARAGASTARSGPTSRSDALPPRSAILRHFGDPSPPARARARCCDVCDAGLVPAPAAARPGAARTPRRRDRVGGARRRQPAVGRTSCAEILHGARTTEDRAQLLRRPARLRRRRRTCAGRTSSPGWTS